MKTIASRMNTIVCQKALPRSRTGAEKTICWYQPSISPATTVAITPETCACSPAI